MGEMGISAGESPNGAVGLITHSRQGVHLVNGEVEEPLGASDRGQRHVEQVVPVGVPFHVPGVPPGVAHVCPWPGEDV